MRHIGTLEDVAVIEENGEYLISIYGRKFDFHDEAAIGEEIVAWCWDLRHDDHCKKMSQYDSAIAAVDKLAEATAGYSNWSAGQ